jgi:hypothetical protein
MSFLILSESIEAPKLSNFNRIFKTKKTLKALLRECWRQVCLLLFSSHIMHKFIFFFFGLLLVLIRYKICFGRFSQLMVFCLILNFSKIYDLINRKRSTKMNEMRELCRMLMKNEVY